MFGATSVHVAMKIQTRTEPKARKTIETIARDHLQVPTLDTRRSDSLDFHEVAVWQLREALEAAYQAGLAAGRRKEG